MPDYLLEIGAEELPADTFPKRKTISKTYWEKVCATPGCHLPAFAL